MPELETDATGETRPRSPVLTWIAAILIVVLSFGLLGECAFVVVLDKPDEARWEAARSDMATVHSALAQHALAHGGVYPPALSDLVPTYFNQLPADPFSKGEYDYKPTRDGYTLTCLGKDQLLGGEAKPSRDIIFTDQGEQSP